MGYWRQVPGECAERLSVSVAPEHLRGDCRLSLMKIRRMSGRGRPKGILA